MYGIYNNQYVKAMVLNALKVSAFKLTSIE
jgi:hypothetical protein